MFRKLLALFAAFAAAVSLQAGVFPTTGQSAKATSATSISWPSDLALPAKVYTHGDGSFTVANEACNFSYQSTATGSSAVTYSQTGTKIDTISKLADGAWQTQACTAHITAGSDSTTFVVQTGAGTSRGNPFRIRAQRKNNFLWATTPYAYKSCGILPQIHSLALGYDGNLYAVLTWGQNASCSDPAELISLDVATGETRFRTLLPSYRGAYAVDGLSTEVMPYDNGIAVINNGIHAYYISYSGTLDSTQTFSPTPPAGSTIKRSAVTKTGRVYILTTKYDPTSPFTYSNHLYYKDVGDTTIHEVSTPSSVLFNEVFATPSGGMVASYGKVNDPSPYIGYYDSQMNQLYEKGLYVDGGANLISAGIMGYTVNGSGSVIVRRTMDVGGNRNVYIDSFDSAGTKTRLFDSDTEFGSAASDIFTTSHWSPQSVTNTAIPIVLCHQTSVSGSTPTTCSAGGNPSIALITASGDFDYPRSEVFAAESQSADYVALGDSYSAGEGLPPFIVPTDNNGGDGCDRSSVAYPPLLATDYGLHLRAFRACSGARSIDIISGMNLEPSQLDSLDSSTEVVTVTAGGNDAWFASFAEQCVISTCDSGSTSYANSTGFIDSSLQSYLENLYGDIRTAAPNAQVYVIGYPRVSPPTGTSCTYFTDSEKTAANDIVDGLNAKALAAVNTSGSGFHFIDPTATGSPFIGHELCTATPYFFGLNIAEHRFSFHPNQDGQVAYAELISNLM